MPVQAPRRSGLLSGNTLKLIAAASMLIDHVGLLFFPGATWLRILGRLAFPIFAYMIAEGCRYTRSRKRYFFLIFALAALCQAVYYLFANSTYMCILVTFSLSILILYALQDVKAAISQRKPVWTVLLRLMVLSAAIYLAYRLHLRFSIDYGFTGTLVPVFAGAFQPRGKEKGGITDHRFLHILMLGVGLILLARQMGGIQFWSLSALPVLLLYSGQRGKRNLKYFFYIFYPAHLAALQGLQMLLQALN